VTGWQRSLGSLVTTVAMMLAVLLRVHDPALRVYWAICVPNGIAWGLA